MGLSEALLWRGKDRTGRDCLHRQQTEGYEPELDLDKGEYDDSKGQVGHASLIRQPVAYCTSVMAISKVPSGWIRHRARCSSLRPKLFFAENS